MSPALRVVLLFIGLLVVVVLGSLYYSRAVRTDDVAPGRAIGAADAPSPAELPDPADLHPRLAAGIEALRGERPKEARDELLAVPSDDPGYLLALQNLSVAYLQIGDLEASLSVLQQYAAVRHEDPDAFLNLGWGHYRLGSHEAAEYATLRALELDPANVAGRFNVALFRLAQGGRLPEVVQAYDRALSSVGFEAYLDTARVHLAALRVSRPEFPDVYYVAAYFSHRLGNTEQEIEDLEMYLGLDPEGPAVEVARQRLEQAREAASRGS